MSHDLSISSIPSAVKEQLMRAGFNTQLELVKCTQQQLMKEAGLKAEEAEQVLKLVRANVEGKSMTADSLSQLELSQLSIVTFSQKIDSMLGDGLPLRKVTELCGMPGVGKTQLSIQLCVDTTIPECFGGVEGESIYIDTEGGFVAERVAQISQATVDHCHLVAGSAPDPEMYSAAQKYSVEKIMKSIHYFRCTSCDELAALFFQLPHFITARCQSKVKLVVVDSMAFHFRYNWTDMASRTKVMTYLSQLLAKLASTFQLAVLLVNQMTTRIDGGDGKVVPALGESWSHLSTNRLLLFCKHAVRYARLFKSPNRKEDTVPFCITAEGVRDVDEPDDAADESPLKRMRIETT